MNVSRVFSRWRGSLLDTVALNDPQHTEFASSLCDALGVTEWLSHNVLHDYGRAWFLSDVTARGWIRIWFPWLRWSLVSEWRHSPGLNTDLVSMVTVELGFWVTSQPGVQYRSGFHGYGRAWFLSDVTARGWIRIWFPWLRRSLVSEWRHSPVLNTDLVSMVAAELGFWVTSQPGVEWESSRHGYEIAQCPSRGSFVAVTAQLALIVSCHRPKLRRMLVVKFWRSFCSPLRSGNSGAKTAVNTITFTRALDKRLARCVV